MCLRSVHYAGIRSSTIAAGLVLRNAADAVQLSNMMRSLPQSVVRRNLLIPISLFLWPGYPLIASGILDGIFWMYGNYVRARMLCIPLLLQMRHLSSFRY